MHMHHMYHTHLHIDTPMRRLARSVRAGILAAALLVAMPVAAGVKPGAAEAEKDGAPKPARALMLAKAEPEQNPLGGERRHRGPHERRPMDEAELDKALALLERVKPELAERLSSLRAEEPREASRVIRERFPRLRHLLRLKEIDPPMYELRVEEVRLSYQSRDLVKEHTEARDAGDAELAAAVRDELSMVLEEHFEVRQQIRRRELELLERRIAALRERIEARAAERETVIEAQIEKMIDTAEREGAGQRE